MLETEAEVASERPERKAFQVAVWRKTTRMEAWVAGRVLAGTAETTMEVGLEGVTLREIRVDGGDGDGDF